MTHEVEMSQNERRVRRDMMVEQVAGGTSTAAVAKMFGVSTVTVINACRAAGQGYPGKRLTPMYVRPGGR